MARTSETYLGDGLYANFDGFHVCLRAPRSDGLDDLVFLDPKVLSAFMRWVKELSRTRTGASEGSDE